MGINLQCDDLPLPLERVQELWRQTMAYTSYPDADVTVRCVSVAEIEHLNMRYRKKNEPTNVLTFSYEDTPEGVVHDVALCLSVATTEARERNTPLNDYVALLLVHAFLHAAGLDHERSSVGAKKYSGAEKHILQRAGFAARSL